MAAAAWLAGAGAALADCRTPDLQITGTGDPAVIGQICHAVESARALLAECGLGQTRPVRIEVLDSLDGPHEACVAQFDCARDVLSILSPTSLATGPRIESAFQLVRPESYFESLIVHELSHGFLAQTRGPWLDPVAHEYLAYATQIRSLPEADRRTFLDALPPTPDGGAASVDALILFFSPARYAANAYRLFTSAEGGCAMLDRLLGDGGAGP